MRIRQDWKFRFTALLALSFFVLSCASTGPKVSREELRQKEEEFHRKFLDASDDWMPRVYRVGYKLLSSHVPEHGDKEPQYRFIGVGATELDKPLRKALGIDKNVKGVLVQGLYPGSRAEGVDIRPRDIVTHLDGKKTKGLGAYFKRIRKTKSEQLALTIWRKGEILERAVPVEKVYYNAQFSLAPTPDLDAHAAFSKIGVGIGAIRYCRNDDELAVIMGHELAHTTLEHSLKKMGTGVSTGIGYGLAAGVISAFTFPGVGEAIVYPIQKATDAAISRRYEREADYFGMKHAFHSGFDVESGAKVFSRLATDTPGFEILAYTFASHPKSAERFLRLEKTVEEFKTKYPEKFPLSKNSDWEVVIPVTAGESLEEALSKLIEKKTLLMPLAPFGSVMTPLPPTAGEGTAATTSGIGTASLPSPGKDQASGYPAPKRS